MGPLIYAQVANAPRTVQGANRSRKTKDKRRTIIMTIRTSRIRRLISFILALPLLAFPIIAAEQGDSSAKPVITFAVIGDTGTGDEAQLSVARQMVRQREKTQNRASKSRTKTCSGLE